MSKEALAHVRSSLVEALLQGDCLLEALDDATYTLNHSEAFGATIGGHYRHCLEHFEALLGAGKTGRVDYDARPRDVTVETDRSVALARTRSLAENFRRELSAEDLAACVSTRCKVSYLGEASPEVPSTLAREAMYAVVHAIHHYALIGVMCRLHGVELPAGFGVAPSTARHRHLSATRD